jgi:AcrR family transcriptional regulator
VSDCADFAHRHADVRAAALDVDLARVGQRLDGRLVHVGVGSEEFFVWRSYLYFDSKEALFKAVIQEGIVPVVAEGEAIAARHSGNAADLLERLLENWWSRIGETEYAGIPKLMVAEARNFPEVAQFYYENVIRRGRALVGAALRRGMASGEFRPMDVETTIEVVIAPILMLLVWRFSMASCLGNEIDPRQYLAIHMDLLRQGLQASRV